MKDYQQSVLRMLSAFLERANISLMCGHELKGRDAVILESLHRAYSDCFSDVIKEHFSTKN